MRRRGLCVWLAIVLLLNVVSISMQTVTFADAGVPAVRVNAALNKTVQVSSEYAQDGWGKEKLVNGTTIGTAGDMGWTSSVKTTSTEEWALIDLAQGYAVDQVVLWPRNDSGMNKGVAFPIDFKIEVSLDKADWQTVVDKTNYSNPSTAAAQIFDFSPVSNVRYVRVTGTKLVMDDHNEYAMQLAEMQVFGVLEGPAVIQPELGLDYKYLNYREDFEQGVPASWTINGSSHKIVDNQLQLESSLGYYTGKEFGDFKYVTEGTYVLGSDTSVVFRAKDANNYYQTNMSTVGGGINLYKNVGGVFTQIGESASFMPVVGKPIRMTLIAEGNKISFTVDDGSGSKTINATDNTYTSGYVGLRTFNSIVNYNYAKVYEKTELPNTDQDNIQIGVFWPPTKAFVNSTQYDYLADAKVDMIMNVDSTDLQELETNKQMLRLAAERGMKVQVSDTRFKNTAWMTDAAVKAIVEDYDGRPGLAGYYVKDEPQVSEYDAYAATYNKFLQYDPDAIPFANMLGGADFNKWVSSVGADNLKYLAYDDYPFLVGGGYRPTHFQVMEIIRKIGISNNLKTARFLQSLGWQGVYKKPTENDMRFDAYTSLAYGFKALYWFTWWTPTGQQESFTDSVIDKDGNKTATFDQVKQINTEIKALGSTLAKLTAKTVYHSGVMPSGGVAVPSDFLWKPNAASDDLLISMLVNEQTGRSYIMAVNKSLTQSKDFTFNIDKKIGEIKEISKATGSEVVSSSYNAETGKLTDTFLAGEGRLYALPADYRIYDPFGAKLESEDGVTDKIMLEWNPMLDQAGIEAPTYHVTIAQDPTFTEIVAEQEIIGNRYEIDLSLYKYYHVKLSGKTASGDLILNSNGILPIQLKEVQNLAYSESFDQDKAGWTTAAGTVALTNGKLRMGTAAGDNSVAYYNAKNFTDFTYELTLVYESGSDTSMLFRYKDINNYYQTNISTHSTAGVMSLYKNVNGTFTQIGNAVPFSAEIGKTYKQTVVIKGNKITFMLDNGTQVRTITATDSAFTEGYIGVRAFHSVVNYDDISVYVQPEGEQDAIDAAKALFLSNISAVTGDLTLPAAGANATTITWLSSNGTYISNDGTLLNRPSIEQGDAALTLTATVTKGASSVNKMFNVTVKAEAGEVIDPNIAAVDEALAALTLGDTSGETGDISLPATGMNDTVVTWLSSNDAYLGNDGKLIARPSSEAGDVALTLTATISKGEVSKTKVFSVTVKAEAGEVIDPNIAAVDEALAALTLGDTSGVTGNISLPTTGMNDTVVTWLSSNDAYLGNDGKLIARPSAEAGDVALTLTATISKGAVSKTKVFNVTIKAEAASGNNGGGNTGGGVVTPTPTPEAANTQTVSSAQLKENNGTIIMQMGKHTLSLPIDTAELLQNHDLTVQTGQAAVVIPSSVLKALQAQAVQELRDAASIIVKVIPAPLSAVIGDSSLHAGETVYDLDLYVVNKEGKETRLASFAEAIRIELPYETSQNTNLIGIYYYNETSRNWEYVGGEVNAAKGMISVEVRHFSSYAVMAYDKQFTDLPSTHWASPAIKALAAKYVVSGVDESHFQPNRLTTRAEFTAMLVRALQLKAVTELAPFKDVASNAWYSESVQAAYAAGLIQGKAADQFAPQAQITREEMAALLIRASLYASQNRASDHAGLDSYQDHDKVSSWAAEAVDKAIQTGLMKGKKAGYFNPSDKVTRSETAQAIWNLLQQ